MPTTQPLDKSLKVNVVTGQGGGGHYAAYKALEAAATKLNLPWEFQVTDMDDIITQLSAQNEIQNAYEMFGFSGHDLYNLMLKSGWTWMWPLKMRLNKFLVKLNYETGCEFFEQHWRKQQPDMVVSFMPLYNKGLAESLQKAKPGTPYITVMTDLADYPPAFWMEPDADCYTVCATDKAIAQGKSLGLSESRLIKASGMVIHPKFYERLELDVATERQKIGLDPQKLTGVVMFGGNGSKAMVDIAKQLERYHKDIQLIFLCGRNDSLAKTIRQLPSQQNRHIVAFTSEVPYYMGLSDFFIGKPGPGSLSEALEMDLPIITERNFSTLIHERYNADWIAEEQRGIVVSSFSKVGSAVEQFLDADTFERYQQTVSAYKNNAVEEVCTLIHSLLSKDSQALSSRSHQTLFERTTTHHEKAAFSALEA